MNNKKKIRTRSRTDFFGACDGTRTCDLRITNALLYQLSYTSIYRFMNRRYCNIHQNKKQEKIKILYSIVFALSDDRHCVRCYEATKKEGIRSNCTNWSSLNPADALFFKTFSFSSCKTLPQHITVWIGRGQSKNQTDDRQAEHEHSYPKGWQPRLEWLK